jgi:benzoyl-CoA reductase/2-hydroxyglutaryl-CoA dehydratase subunit BcrC/BadD/HgdB
MKTNSTIDDQINHYKTHISELTTELEALQFSKTVRLNWFERFALNLIIKISPQFKKSLPSWYVKDVTVNNLEYATARKNRLEVELGK